MRSVVVIIVGMFLAAIVAFTGTLVIQSSGLVEKKPAAPEGALPVAAAEKQDIAALEQKLADKINMVQDSIVSLGARLEEVQQKLAEIEKQAPDRPAVAAGETSLEPGEGATLADTISRVLDDREKRREEEREKERAERTNQMIEGMKTGLTSRLNEYAQEKAWTAAKSQQVQQVLSEYMEKAGELMRNPGDRGPGRQGFQQFAQLMDEARTKLSEILTEDEINELMRSIPGPFRGRGPGGPPGGGPGGNQPGGGQPR
jgi:hypothetical protein